MTWARPRVGADQPNGHRRRLAGGGADQPLDRAPWRRPRVPRTGTIARWTAATVLLALAAVLLSSGSSGAAGPTTAVLVAAHDLAPGVAMRAGDVRVVRLPAADVPAGALRPGARTLGQRLSAPARRGEPLTDVRLMGPALIRASGFGPDVVATPVRIADPGVLALLRAGDRVDVLAVRTDAATTDATGSQPTNAHRSPEENAAHVVATDVVVLTVPAPAATTAEDGALVVLATTHAVAGQLAAESVRARLSLTVRGR